MVLKKCLLNHSIASGDFEKKSLIIIVVSGYFSVAGIRIPVLKGHGNAFRNTMVDPGTAEIHVLPGIRLIVLYPLNRLIEADR